MHYLTCGHCGSENEVTSEYLVFCGNCNRKMANNYPAWSSENPGKTLDDYKNEVCHTKPVVTANQLKKSAETAAPGKFLKKLLVGLLVILLLSFAGFFLFKAIFFQTLEKYSASEWTVQTCGTLGLRLSSPVALQASHNLENEITPEARRLLVKIESWVHETRNRKLRVMANSFQYNPGISISLNGAVEGSIREIRSRKGVSGFTYDIASISYNGIPGRLITGRWKEDKMVVGFQEAIFAQGSFMWQVHAGYDYQDPQGEDIASRIIGSIMIHKDFASMGCTGFIASLPATAQPAGARQHRQTPE
ncbi:MAG: hypothetical protein ACNA7V_12065 [Bacteroidales bacterium]